MLAASDTCTGTEVENNVYLEALATARPQQVHRNRVPESIALKKPRHRLLLHDRFPSPNCCGRAMSSLVMAIHASLRSSGSYGIRLSTRWHPNLLLPQRTLQIQGFNVVNVHVPRVVRRDTVTGPMELRGSRLLSRWH